MTTLADRLLPACPPRPREPDGEIAPPPERLRRLGAAHECVREAARQVRGAADELAGVSHWERERFDLSAMAVKLTRLVDNLKAECEAIENAE